MADTVKNLSISKFAARVGVSVETVRNYDNEGKFPAFKMGVGRSAQRRYSEQDIQDWLDGKFIDPDKDGVEHA